MRFWQRANMLLFGIKTGETKLFCTSLCHKCLFEGGMIRRTGTGFICTTFRIISMLKGEQHFYNLYVGK